MATATKLQLRRGTSAQMAAFIGGEGEVTPDMTNRRLVLHDGVTPGGFPQATESYVQTAISSLTAGNSTNLLLARTCV